VLAALGRFVHVSKENHDSCRVCGRILLTDVESFPVSEVLINPRASALGSVNAILNGRSTRHHESQFAGPLSIKTVIAGSAAWETGEGRFELVPGTVLLLNDGEEYTVTVAALQPVETFCLFFERGFVEDAARAATTGSARLLDAPDRVEAVSFYERLMFDPALMEEVLRAYRVLGSSAPRVLGGQTINRGPEGPRTREAVSESFYTIALQLVRMQCDVNARVAKLPSVRAATRDELARRLAVATSYLHANSARGVTIAEAARATCLSPFHFHRLFTQFHGVTPHRYLSRLRLERARALLRSSDRSVLDVAIDCGFESLGSFSALYKRTFGVTPGLERPNSQEPRNVGAGDGSTLQA